MSDCPYWRPAGCSAPDDMHPCGRCMTCRHSATSLTEIDRQTRAFGGFVPDDIASNLKEILEIGEAIWIKKQVKIKLGPINKPLVIKEGGRR